RTGEGILCIGVCEARFRGGDLGGHTEADAVLPQQVRLALLMEPALRPVTGADLDRLRGLLSADLHRERASRVEPASLRRRDQAGRLTQITDLVEQRLLVALEATPRIRGGIQQQPRVWMLRIVDDFLGIPA